ncbi:hypothetical protein A5736_00210 [Mycobacterium sp. SP-6446]|nr:hypothetical protein A5736_00210 [Mycobacterium sp. SP-6446]
MANRLLHVGVAGGQPPPVQGTDQFGDRDGFGVDRGEQFGGTEGFQLGAQRDEQLRPPVPPMPCVARAGFVAGGPSVRADEEPSVVELVSS